MPDAAQTATIGQYDFQARKEAAQSLLDSEVHVLSRPHRKTLDHLIRQCAKAMRATDMGFRPTVPPDQWLAGFVRKPGWRHAGRIDRSYYDGPIRFPHEAIKPGTYRAMHRVFQAPIPIPEMARITDALQFFGNDELRVYSPHRSDFTSTPSSLASVPMVMGRLSVGGESVFFEVARWHAKGDLSASYGGKETASDIEDSIQMPASEGDVTDVTDVVYGWRRYNLSWSKGKWCLFGSWAKWESREKTASCSVQGMHGDFQSVEHGRCQCGIYSLKDRDDLRRVPFRANVDALVVMWGTVREYQRGYRAEHVRIERLYIPEGFRHAHNTHDISSQLKDQFGFEVELEWMEERSA